jgi:hypothetical protein
VNVAPETCRAKNEENKLDLLHLVGILFIKNNYLYLHVVFSADDSGVISSGIWFAVLTMTFRAGENCKLRKYLLVASLRNMEVKCAGQRESLKSLCVFLLACIWDGVAHSV